VRRLIACIVSLIAATIISHTQNAQPADYLFTNGQVYTVDKDNS